MLKLVKICRSWWLFAGLLAFTATAEARDVLIASTMQEYCEGKLIVGQEILPPISMGIGGRRFLGTGVPVTAENELLLARKEVVAWRLELYPVASREAALAHIEQYASRLDLSVTTGDTYIVHPEAATTNILTLTPEEQRATIARWLNDGQGEVIEATIQRAPHPLWGRPTQVDFQTVSRERIELLIDPSQVFVRNGAGMFGPHFAWFGWTAQDVTGLIVFRDMFDRGTFKDVAWDLRKLRESGHSIVWNRTDPVRFRESIEVLRQTIRTRDGISQDISMSRYSSEEVVRETMESFRMGTIFAVDVVNAENRVVATLLVRIDRETNRVEPDTVGYPASIPITTQNPQNPNSELAGVNAARAVLTVAIARFAAAGVTTLNAGMITAISGEVGARPYHRSEYLPLIEEMSALGPREIDESPLGPVTPLTPAQIRDRQRAREVRWWTEMMSPAGNQRLEVLALRNELPELMFRAHAAPLDSPLIRNELARIDTLLGALRSDEEKLASLGLEASLLDRAIRLEAALRSLATNRGQPQEMVPTSAQIAGQLIRIANRVAARDLAETLIKRTEVATVLARTELGLTRIFTERFAQIGSPDNLRAQVLAPDFNGAALANLLSEARIPAGDLRSIQGQISGARNRILASNQELQAVEQELDRLRRELRLTDFPGL